MRHLGGEGEIGLVDVAGLDMRLHRRQRRFDVRPALISGRAAPAQAPAGSGRKAAASTSSARSNRPNQSKGGASGGRRRRASGASLVLERVARPRRRGSRRHARRAAARGRRGPRRDRASRRSRAGRVIEQRPAAGPGVVEQDEGRAHACHDARSGPFAPRQERKFGLQRLRPLQDRGRSIQLAHDGTDDGRLPLCRGAARRRPARSGRRTGRGRPLRLARSDRQGPRHRPRHPARPLRRAARPDRPRRGRRDRSRESARPAGSRSAATHEIAFDEAARRPLPPARAAAAPQQRHALHRVRRGRRRCSPAPSPIRSAAAPWSTRRRSRATRRPKAPGTCRYRYSSGDQLLAIAAREGAEHRRHRPRQRARRARRRGDRRPARRDRRRDVGLHRPRHGRRAASCPAGSTSSAARPPSTAC